MNILKRSLAPITDRAWEEIELQSERVIREYTTGRRFADINGPLGLEYGAASTGRLILPSDQPSGGLQYGIREVIPLVEVRRDFSLDLRELDNASRNAKDIDLKNLEEAARQVSSFEDQCLYQGFEETSSPGLLKGAAGNPAKFQTNAEAFMKTLLEMIASLQQEAVEGPYALVIPDTAWRRLAGEPSAYPLPARLREITGGAVITHHTNKEVFVVSQRGGDIELVLGQDISLGYDMHDREKVDLYFTASFAWRILSPEAFRVMIPG